MGDQSNATPNGTTDDATSYAITTNDAATSYATTTDDAATSYATVADDVPANATSGIPTAWSTWCISTTNVRLEPISPTASTVAILTVTNDAATVANVLATNRSCSSTSRIKRV